jgi:hypothetical protein
MMSTSSPVMTMLSNGIPISLLCDLASITEPDSAAINLAERPASDPIWLEAAQPQRRHLRAVSA